MGTESSNIHLGISLRRRELMFGIISFTNGFFCRISGQESRIEGGFVGGIFQRKRIRQLSAEIGGKIFENFVQDSPAPERHLERRRLGQGHVGRPGPRVEGQHREEVERAQVQRGEFFQA